MKTFIKFIAALFVLLLPIVQTEAQCPNNNTQFGTSSAPVTVGQLVTLSTCIYGGEYRLVNNLQAGSVYSFETCGDTDFDTQVTVYDASDFKTLILMRLKREFRQIVNLLVKPFK